MIYIYKDLGVSRESLKQTLNTFQKHLGKKYTIQTISAEGVILSDWQSDCKLLVIPGGSDVPYTRKLNGLGNQKIIEYVENGGRYLGICAGGYYGSGSIEFDVNGEFETIGLRELGFFKGKAVGPVFDVYSYHDNSSAIVTEIDVDGIGKVGTFFNGGCYFENAEQYDGVEVIGRYSKNNLPAIIRKDRIILSGVHFEYDPSTFTSPDIMHIKDELSSHQIKRLELVDYIFSLLGI